VAALFVTGAAAPPVPCAIGDVQSGKARREVKARLQYR